MTIFQDRETYRASINWANKQIGITDNNARISYQVMADTPWSHVIEIKSDNKTYYLKHTPEQFSHEPDIIEFLAEHTRAAVPQVIAKNNTLRCFLMCSAGETIRSSLERKFDISLIIKTIDAFLALQRDASAHIDGLIKVGVADYRLTQLPALFDQVCEDNERLALCGLTISDRQKLLSLKRSIQSACDTLSCENITETIVQPDFNTNNALINETNGSISIIDLGECVISHPFFSLFSFLYHMKKCYQLEASSTEYKRIEKACFSSYQIQFGSEKDFRLAYRTAEQLQLVYSVVDQIRFINVCGIEHLKAHGHWKINALIRTMIQSFSAKMD